MENHKNQEDQKKPEVDYLLKLLIIGNSSVGKTSLLSRYLSQKFPENTLPTLGMDTKSKIFQKSKKTIKIHFWDTAGQERFRSLTPMLYKDIKGVIIVYDITKRKSFDDKKIWLKLIKENCKEELKIMMIGNKCDLNDNREVMKEEGIKFCENKGFFFFETSAKKGDFVDLAFEKMCEGIIEEEIKQRDLGELEKYEEIRRSVMKIGKKEVVIKKKYCC